MCIRDRWTLAADINLNAGATHVYALYVNVRLDLAPTSGSDNVYTRCETTTPGDPQANEGLFNESQLDVNDDGVPDQIDDACGDIPSITHDKEFVSATPAVNDTWNVVYRIVATNAGGATGVYTLTDQPIFCLLYTSPSPRDRTRSRMPSSA